MIPPELRPPLGALLDQLGWGSDADLPSVAGGGNNQVLRVDAGTHTALLKVYFRHPEDRRDRLGAEFAFARFAWDHGVRQVPQPLACAPEAGLALYEFIEGRKLTTGEVDAEAVAQAIGFCVDLNTHRNQPGARFLPDGAEACFTLADHLACVERRLTGLEQIHGSTAIDTTARAFVRGEVLPRWVKVHEQVETQAAELGLVADEPLSQAERCLSPSDFGFHNVLRQPNGRLRIFDFEYAGWDDPAKLVCDFFCQPAVPVPATFLPEFSQRVCAALDRPEAAEARVRLLLPVYQLKWVAILLNEFSPAGLRRRRFAQSDIDLEARKAAQMDKARQALHFLDK